MPNVKYLKLLTACFSLLVLGVNYNSTVSSPTPQPPIPMTPIFVGEQIVPDETKWSLDSQTLYFEGIDAILPTRSFQYSVRNKQLGQRKTPGLTITLTKAQQVQFNSADSLAYVSPNGRYIVYADRDQKLCGYDSGCQHNLVLGDLQNGKHGLLQMGVGGVHYGSIHWSRNSTALVIKDWSTPVSGIFYVKVPSNFDIPIDNLLLMNIDPLGEGIIDISPDGSRVLVGAQWDIFITGLYIWDATQPSSNQQFAALDGQLILKDTPIAGAAFLPNRNQILVVTDVGIIRYDLGTKISTLQYSGINTSWIRWARFSPDRQQVAIWNWCVLYVVPLNKPVIEAPLKIPPCHNYG